MVSNKKRLYVALYPSGVVNNEELMYLTSLILGYHWGFLIGPKVEAQDQIPGVRYHEVPLRNVRSTVNLLARILVAKIEDEARLVEILRSTPIVQGDSESSCITWLADALRRIREDGKAVGTSQLDWARIEPLAREYVAEKKAGGRYGQGADMSLPKPTWDLLKDKEIVA
ncbi:hypothetical protein C8A00DRAFT_47513 [Chaetomidium leptoderma]|uniref:Uncharacterized protein n=1 Tax=Chaetomidium leptoderma TaxID=669021 RepID=A0AAN6ZSL6_9PEZI|nr:hypothetical protein C8A00DRAFT_47513 [Chaetomidium leptoderma]